MKRFKNYAFLGLVLGLVLTLTPTQSFASRYLAVGHRTDPTADVSVDPTAQSANMTDSAQPESINIFDQVIGYLAGFL